MTFKSSVIPGVRAFASNMRVKLSREPVKSARGDALFTAPRANTSTRASIGWRICPVTGQLQQRWSFDDSQDPQSLGSVRKLAKRQSASCRAKPELAQPFERASPPLNLYVEARVA